MKSRLNKLRNFIPYLILIFIYFFFINLEARKDQIKNQNNKDIKYKKEQINKNSSNIRLSIPVIPYD